MSENAMIDPLIDDGKRIRESGGDSGMIYALSDIHGCLDELRKAMTRIDPDEKDRIIFLGDYLDYGKDSGGVLRYIYELQRKYGKERIIVLKGNHEEMFLEWLDEYRKKKKRREAFFFDSWLKTDAEQEYNTFRTLVSEEQIRILKKAEATASFDELNVLAAEMIISSCPELIRWMRELPLWYETEDQIFVHAGINEEAEEDWKWGTGEDVFLWKYPASKGAFLKDIIAGHIASAEPANDKDFHDVFYDGKSHYYIDGSVYRKGKLLLLAYDEKTKKYYQSEETGLKEIRALN